MRKSLSFAKTAKWLLKQVLFKQSLFRKINDDYRKTDLNKLENFTSFNDAIQSFFTLKCPTPMLELKEDEMKKLFLTTGQIRMIASKNTDIISQFLEIVA